MHSGHGGEMVSTIDNYSAGGALSQVGGDWTFEEVDWLNVEFIEEVLADGVSDVRDIVGGEVGRFYK